MTTAIQVKERPILFSGAMVKALLAGTKTQTRRAVKPQPDEASGIEIMHNGTSFEAYDLQDWLTGSYQGYGFQDEDQLWRCPYGQPGDRLWVRETWRYPAGECPTYRADYPEADAKKLRWKPSIFMPRAASRLLLEITAVRCERLQSISEADAVAEGIEPVLCPTTAIGNVPARKWKNYEGRAYCDGMNLNHASESYRTLWQSINGPDSWEANPWVWVVEFKVFTVNA